MTSSTPSVSIVLAVLDEAGHIDACLATLAAQTYEGSLEVVVADGGSTDGTRERIAAWAPRFERLLVVDNPRRRQSHGLNLAAGSATGEVLVRADGHTTYADDYVDRSVAALQSDDVVAAGGLLRPVGTTPFGRAVAAAMTSPLAIGPGAFHHARERRHADTVYLGAFRRADFTALGGYRAFPSGAAEDADLYYRWRRAGRAILVDPAISSVYRPRESVGSFARQSFRYGQGKAEMLYRNGRLPSWRPLAPLALVAGLGAGVAIGVGAGTWWPLAVGGGAWATVVAGVALRRGGSVAGAARVAGAVGVMHLAYGAGLAWGLVRGPWPLRGA